MKKLIKTLKKVTLSHVIGAVILVALTALLFMSATNPTGFHNPSKAERAKVKDSYNATTRIRIEEGINEYNKIVDQSKKNVKGYSDGSISKDAVIKDLEKMNSDMKVVQTLISKIDNPTGFTYEEAGLLIMLKESFYQSTVLWIDFNTKVVTSIKNGDLPDKDLEELGNVSMAADNSIYDTIKLVLTIEKSIGVTVPEKTTTTTEAQK